MPEMVIQSTTLRWGSAVGPLPTEPLHLGGCSGGPSTGAARRRLVILVFGRPDAHTRKGRAMCTVLAGGGTLEKHPSPGPRGEAALEGSPASGLRSQRHLRSPEALLRPALPGPPPPPSGIPRARGNPAADRFSPSLSLSGCAAFVIKYCYIYLRIG